MSHIPNYKYVPEPPLWRIVKEPYGERFAFSVYRRNDFWLTRWFKRYIRMDLASDKAINGCCYAFYTLQDAEKALVIFKEYEVSKAAAYKIANTKPEVMKEEW